MSRRLLILCMLIVGALSAHVVSAAYLEGDEGKAEVTPPPRVLPAPNPLVGMVRRLTVRPGYRYGGLTVFLVDTSEVTDEADYLSVEEALRKRVLTVREKDRAEVPALLVQNRGKEPVLMLGGELLLGGQQNRTLRDDVLLPPRSGFIEVPVLCIERGRWSGAKRTFEGRQVVAAFRIRAAAQAGRPQSEIWAGVEDYGRKLDVASGTSDLGTIQGSGEVRKVQERYRKAFAKHCWRPGAVGMVVARYGRIVGADLFCNASLFRKHRDRLLDSYVVDCCAYRKRGPSVGPDRRDAERFLERVFGASFRWKDSPGSGRLLVVSGDGMSGSALVNRGNVLHACLCPPDQVIIKRALPLLE